MNEFAADSQSVLSFPDFVSYKNQTRIQNNLQCLSSVIKFRKS
jgi:hypothetical protein